MQTMDNLIRQRRENSVLWLELHNPPVNFLTADICAELYQCFRAAEQDAGIRSIVLGGGLFRLSLHGRGRGFHHGPA